MDKPIDDELAKLYPGLTPDRYEGIRENLDQYLLLAWDIMEEQDAKPSDENTDTSPTAPETLKDERIPW